MFLISACGGDDLITTGNLKNRTVNISQGSGLLSLDPYLHFEAPTFSIQRNIFEPLTDTDANMNIIPALAESWSHEDTLTWIFKLRRNVRFHHGQTFTASDVVFSIRRALEWPRSQIKSEVAVISEITADDDHTLRITTWKPDAILPRRLTSLLIMDAESSRAILDEKGESGLAVEGNGTGPYHVESWTRDKPCILKANKAWWGGIPAIPRLKFSPTSSDATRMAMLKQGRVDLFVHVPPRFVENISGMPGYRIVEQPGIRLIYLGLDVGRNASPGVHDSPPNPLRDRRVREAILLAIDNGLIVEKIMAGHARPADQLFPANIVGHEPDYSLQRPNPGKARRLLREAGYEKGFHVRLDGPNDRYVNDARIMEAVAAQLARVNIRVDVNAQPKARFFSQNEQAQCSFFLIGWSCHNGDGSTTFDHLLHTNEPQRNLGVANTSTQYSNPELDRLAEASASEFDETRREALLRRANRVAMRDLVHIPLHYQLDMYALSSRVVWQPRTDVQIRGVDISWNPE